MIESYPLYWPVGRKRTPAHQRTRARFGKKSASESGSWKTTKELTVSQALARLFGELRRLGVDNDTVIVSTNIRTRSDGLPYSNARMPDDPGVAVWFMLNGVQKCMPSDSWDRVADNVAAIAAHIAASRAIERYGVQDIDQQFAGFTAITDQNNGGWWAVLGVGQNAAHDDVEQAYKRLRSAAHPDRGGDPGEFDRVNKAWQAFLEQKG
jgi:hypothetical protein